MRAPICWSPPRGPLWKAGDGQLERLAQQPAGGAGGVQQVVGEDVPVVFGPLEEVAFPVVVGDEGDALLGEYSNFAVVRWADSC